MIIFTGLGKVRLDDEDLVAVSYLEPYPQEEEARMERMEVTDDEEWIEKLASHPMLSEERRPLHGLRVRSK